MPHPLAHEELVDLSDRMEDLPAPQVLAWALERFGDRVAIASSFQAEDLVLIDLAVRLCPSVRVFTVDTGRLPEETLDMVEQVRARYGISVEVLYPDAAAVEALVRAHGPNLFYRSVDLRLECCRVRKVEPLRRHLATLDAWIVGLRRDQSPTRARVRKVALDTDHGGKVKISPLADWTHEDVWRYVEEHRLPRHPLYDRGYLSIGCAPCTRPVRPGEDPRAGRWWWERGAAKECGIHRSLLARSLADALDSRLLRPGAQGDPPGP